MRYLLYCMILLPALVGAAGLSGTVYDLSLDKVSDVIIEINSTPMQRIVAVDGKYVVALPVGSYRISVSHMEGSTNYSALEYIDVVDEGEYVLDLFLYPQLEEDYEDIDIPEIYLIRKSEGDFRWLIFGVVLVVIVSVYFLVKNRSQNAKKIEVDENLAEDMQQVIDILRRHGGRITQKELRKEIGMSEAKISLMVAELEHLGQLKKIKKGRGNIIALR